MTITDVGGFDAPFDAPFWGSGSSVDASVSNIWPVTLDGMGFALDDRENKLRFRSIPHQRAAFDERDTPGKGTLNPEAFWRRRFESWDLGAGQDVFDAADSSEFRFRRSRGVDVWTRNQVSLLNATAQKRVSANTNLFTAIAGSFFYLTDGTTLQRTADLSAYTAITGGTAAAFTSIASDGFNVLLACGTAAGIDKTTRGAATKTNHITGGTITHVSYGKGRWIAAQDNVIYDITTLVAAGGALPAAFYTNPNTDFDFNCFAEGPTALYAAGFSGDKSLIYRLTMKEDGTGLNQPVVAGFLPDGELIQSMQGYAGFVLIGTSEGVRFAIPGGNADLTIGSLIETDTVVRCFEGQGQFVWYGWSDFEGTHHGLGRLNLQRFAIPDELVPAHASDLLTLGTGTVLSVATFLGIRVWTVSGTGVWAEDTANLSADGEIDSGSFDYGLTDEKLSLFVDMTHISHNGGSHSVYLSTDRSSFAHLATHSTEHEPIATGQTMGREFEVRIVLTRDGSDPSMGPVIRAWALRVQPVPPVTEVIEAPLLLTPIEARIDGYVTPEDVRTKLARIKALCQDKPVVVFTVGLDAYSVIVDDYVADTFEIWVGELNAMAPNTTCNVKLKQVS